MGRGRQIILGVVLLLLIVGTLWYVFTRPPEGKITLEVPRSITVGQTFEIPLRVSVPQAINAGEFYFSFPTDLVEVTEIKKDGSFYELWIKDSPGFSNQTGIISLAGGLPSPGFSGSDALVGTIVFKAKTAGSGQITLDETKTRLLANDGLGSLVPAAYRPVTITVK